MIPTIIFNVLFFFSSRRRHTRYWRDWSSDVCSSDLDSRWERGYRRPDEQCPRSQRESARGRLEEAHALAYLRSEERRVGKECRSRAAQKDQKKKKAHTLGNSAT